MQKLLLFYLFFLFGGFSVSAQQVGLFINDPTGGIRVMKNTFLYIQGDLQILDITPVPVTRLVNGQIYLEGDLVCNKKFVFERDSMTLTSRSELYFVGTDTSRIRGTVPPQLFDVIVNKTSGANVYFDLDVELHDTINFVSGNGIIAPDVDVNLIFRQGTNTVNAHPYLKNETAAHRFTGDGYVSTTFLVPSIHDEDVANTGFYFRRHGADTLHLRRGHTKQLYAGEGSVDRYFDVNFQLPITNTPNFDSIAFRYIPDVNYTAMGVDTSKLRMYISPVFDDATYYRAETDFQVGATRHNLYTNAAFTNPANSPSITPIYFRYTLGDTTCSLPPYTALTDSILHLCLGDTVSLSASNQQSYGFPNSVSYFWNDSSIVQNRDVFAVSTYKEYIVKLTDQRGCYTFDTIRVDAIAPNPSVGFRWDNVCEGLPSQLIDTSSISSGSFTSSWNFGDATTLPNPSNDTISHLYTSAGGYFVTLTSTSNYGCVSTLTDSVSVYNYPIANFSLTENCYYNQFVLDGDSSVGITIPASIGIIPGCSNYFLDGSLIGGAYDTLMTLPNSLSIGNHTMSLVVKALNCYDTLIKPFTVYQKDTAGFTVTTACVYDTISLTNTSLIINGPANYFWDFGDGTTSTDFEPVKIYSSPGLKVIQLIVQTTANCADTFALSITVNGLPSTNFVIPTICVGSNVNFGPQTFVPTNSYTWDFGNGDTGITAFESTTYASAGTYPISLTVQDLNGCSAINTQQLNLQALPIASFNAPAVCEGQATAFFNTSVGNTLTSVWNFGDFSVTSTLTEPTHLYLNDGSYNVNLTVTDTYGCQNTISQAVLVDSLPLLTLGSLSTCGSSYILDALNPGSNYLWSPTNETTQTINVTVDGNYSVTITDANGCILTAPATVALNSQVQPNLGIDTAICGSIVLNGGYGPSADYLWNTGDTTLTINVSTAGIYGVTVTDQNLCIGTDSIVILNVFPFATPNLGPDIQTCSSNFPLVLNPGSYSAYQWSDNTFLLTHPINNTTALWVKVTDANGCFGYDTIAVVGLNSPISDLPLALTACDQIALVASANMSYNFSWEAGLGGTNNFYNAISSGTYSVQITDPITSCSIQDSTVVTINNSPVVNLGADIIICANIGVVLNAQNPGSSYQWISSSSANVGTAQSYSPPSSDVYVVQVTNNGCSASDAISVTLLPAPYIPVQASVRYICGSTPVNLLGSPFGNNSWTATTGFISANQNISVFEAGDYYVTASIAGCSASDTIELAISPQQIQAFYLVDTDTSKNLALQFIDLSTPEPISYLWSFGDGTYDSVANPIHTFPIVATFNTSLTISNGVCISTYNKEVNAKNFVIDSENPVSSLEQLSFNLFPNPVTDQLHYDFLLNDQANVEVILYDIRGTIVKRVGELKNSEAGEFIIDTYDLQPGVYYLGMRAQSLKGNQKQTLKVIKL